MMFEIIGIIFILLILLSATVWLMSVIDTIQDAICAYI